MVHGDSVLIDDRALMPRSAVAWIMFSTVVRIEVEGIEVEGERRHGELIRRGYGDDERCYSVIH